MKKMMSKALLCGLTALIVPAAMAQDRVSTTEKGSVLIYPKVEIRWDGASGELIQDTFITMTNDWNFGPDVTVQMYFVNGDDWKAVDADITLTPDQPTYWSAFTGEPGTQGGLSFTIVGPGGIDDPEGTGDKILRGYILAYAVDGNGKQIRWNHLFGEGTIVNYMNGTAWSYNAYAFSAIAGANGDTVGTAGILNFDGVDYDQVFNTLLLNFFAEGSEALSSPTETVSVTTDLTLLPVSADLREVDLQGFPPVPVGTKASFIIHNANEAKRTGTERCVICWDQALLSTYGMAGGAQNWFLREFLGTDNGKAVIDGIRDANCDVNYDPDNDDVKCFCGWCPLGIDDVPANNDPRDICTTDEALLGVAAKFLSYGTRDAAAGDALRGKGIATSQILVDLLSSGGGSEESVDDAGRQLIGTSLESGTNAGISRR